MNTALLAMLGWPEIMGILVVVLILFGAKKLPELARGLGSGIKEFKKATRDVQDDLHRALDDDPYHSPPPAPSRESAPAPKSKAESGDGKSAESKTD
ncbi:MAG: Sec-independent protein translocase subunit TatA/TatB [Limisphaerales bacterium]